MGTTVATQYRHTTIASGRSYKPRISRTELTIESQGTTRASLAHFVACDRTRADSIIDSAHILEDVNSYNVLDFLENHKNLEPQENSENQNNCRNHKN